MLSTSVHGKRSSLARQPEGAKGLWIVLHLAPKKRGSVEEQLLALGRRLHHDGITLTCIFSQPPPRWLTTAFAHAGVQVRTLAFDKPYAPLQFAAALLRERPPLVHFHFVRAYSPLVALARALGARVIVHDHMTLGVPYVPVPTPSRAWVIARDLYKKTRARLLNRLIARRVAVSRFVAERVRAAESVDEAQLTVIENGINLPRFACADARQARTELGIGGRPLAVCVSRLAADKGVDTLLHAFRLTAEQARLVIVGDGPERDKLCALARRLGLDERVQFVGVRDDVERLYAAADVVVQPSQFEEAFGLSVIEAMAASRPTLVTASGAMPELVDYGRAGVVVPRGDAAALATALQGLFGDRARARTLAEAARRRAEERFGMDTFVARVVALYREIVPSLWPAT
jgi:glycosyltransferase involved in cell wall biosynthesis